MKVVFGIIVIAQLVLHYLGWIGIILGIIALVFSNTERGIELLISGIGFIVLKYVIGIIFLGIKSLANRGGEGKSVE